MSTGPNASPSALQSLASDILPFEKTRSEFLQALARVQGLLIDEKIIVRRGKVAPLESTPRQKKTAMMEEDEDALVASSSLSSSSSNNGGKERGGGGGGGSEWHSTVEYVRTGQPMFSPDTITTAAAAATITTATITSTTATTTTATTTSISSSTNVTDHTIGTPGALTPMESFEITVHLRRFDRGTGLGPGLDSRKNKSNASEQGPGKKTHGGGRESVQVYCPKYHRGKVASYFLVVAVAVTDNNHNHSTNHNSQKNNSHHKNSIDDNDNGHQSIDITPFTTSTTDEWDVVAVKNIKISTGEDHVMEATGMPILQLQQVLTHYQQMNPVMNN